MYRPVLLLSTLCFAAAGCAQQPEAEQEDAQPALQSTIAETGGNLVLPAGIHYLDAPLEFDLAELDAIAVTTDGPVTLVMRGLGPAIRITGTHEGTASPKSFKPETWRQRMPRLEGFEILGAHPEADGIALKGTMQATISGVAVRNARHGIHLIERNRNVIISECHLYQNSGVGIYLDDVNLHQINISNSHISYNVEGGIVVRDGEVRNLHITGCDIEGNMPQDLTPTETANVLIDLSAHRERTSVCEVAITGCTIQHSAGWHKEGILAPGGANIRLIGRPEYPIDTVTIGNNLLSDTTVNVEIIQSTDIVLTGNTFFTPMPHDLIVRDSERVVVQANTFNPRADWAGGTIEFHDSSGCVFGNSTIHQYHDETASILLENCSNMRLTNLILSDVAAGIVLRDCTDCEVLDCDVPLEDGVTVTGGKGNRVLPSWNRLFPRN